MFRESKQALAQYIFVHCIAKDGRMTTSPLPGSLAFVLSSGDTIGHRSFTTHLCQFSQPRPGNIDTLVSTPPFFHSLPHSNQTEAKDNQLSAIVMQAKQTRNICELRQLSSCLYFQNKAI